MSQGFALPTPIPGTNAEISAFLRAVEDAGFGGDQKLLGSDTTAQCQRAPSKLGLSLTILEAGCFGIAGLFGDRTDRQTLPKTLLDQIWRGPVNQHRDVVLLVASYFCRSQVKQFLQSTTLHPAQVIVELLDAEETRGGQ